MLPFPEQKENNAIKMSIKNSSTSNIMETDTPRYNDNDPPRAETIVLVSYKEYKRNYKRKLRVICDILIIYKN
jgi:hypothetical protein